MANNTTANTQSETDCLDCPHRRTSDTLNSCPKTLLVLCRLLSITRLDTFFLFSHNYAALVMWRCYTICIIKSN